MARCETFPERRPRRRRGAGLQPDCRQRCNSPARDRAVTVVERHGFPGGRVGQADIRGYRIDTGATVLTMPDIIEDAFDAVGASMGDYLELMLLDPAYRASFADGSTLDVRTDAAAMTSAIEQFAGPDQAAGYLRLREG